MYEQAKLSGFTWTEVEWHSSLLDDKTFAQKHSHIVIFKRKTD